MQSTPGAQFRDDLDIPHPGWCCAKASGLRSRSYSAFYENDRTTPTGLSGYLRERGLTRVFLAGLALDFCVRYSAEDAHREGLAAVVIADALRHRRGGVSRGDAPRPCRLRSPDGRLAALG